VKPFAQIISRSPEETVAFAAELAEGLGPATVIALAGDLGAGKTQFARGLARGLGCPGRVQSPSFGLINIYEGGRLPLYHLDLYRLETPEEIAGAGLDEYLSGDTDGVVAVEWAERWFGPMDGVVSGALIRVAIESLGETERSIRCETGGA